MHPGNLVFNAPQNGNLFYFWFSQKTISLFENLVTFGNIARWVRVRKCCQFSLIRRECQFCQVLKFFENSDNFAHSVGFVKFCNFAECIGTVFSFKKFLNFDKIWNSLDLESVMKF